MEILMGTPFVQLPFEKFGMWTTETWLKMMWNNLGILEIELFWCNLPSLPLHRERDRYRMAEFSGLYDMYRRKMRILNCVRLSM